MNRRRGARWACSLSPRFLRANSDEHQKSIETVPAATFAKGTASIISATASAKQTQILVGGLAGHLLGRWHVARTELQRLVRYFPAASPESDCRYNCRKNDSALHH